MDRKGRDAARDLIRTAVRTFYGTKHILVIDALMTHSVLHAEDLGILLSSQPKDVRRLVGPLRASRILWTHSRNEAKIGSTRGVVREYYFIPFHAAIDAIKYRVMKLTKRVEELYQQDTVRKDWRCPHCKAEWEELEVLHNLGPEGFECLRCGTLLERTEQAAEPTGGHEKIKRLNVQLKRLQDLIETVDQLEIPPNTFEDALDLKREVPREKTGQVGNQYITLKNNPIRKKVVEQTDAAALAINLTDSEQQEADQKAKLEQARAELARQNALPTWHTQSVLAMAGLKAEDNAAANGNLLKKEDSDEKKPDVGLQDDLAAYLAEMQREKEEAALKAAEEDAESEDEDDFEDVVSTNMGTPLPGTGTPASSQQAPTNGVKRELESESGVSSEANTPATGTLGGRDAKRVKFENGDVSSNVPSVAASGGADSEEDEEDFEDAM
jgi:transcription initiation factor TFIIE subunit alpha